MTVDRQAIKAHLKPGTGEADDYGYIEDTDLFAVIDDLADAIDAVQDGIPSQASELQTAAAGVGAITRTVLDKLRDVVNVRDFGAVGDGVADDTSALNAAFSSGAKTVQIAAGTYRVTGSVIIPAAVSVIGEGSSITTITAAGNTTGTFITDSTVTKEGAVPTQIASLSTTATKGGTTLTFSSGHGLAAGDVALIYNPTDGSFNPSRPTYRAGEFVTVASVTSPTEVVLEQPLFDTYTAAAVNVYKCAGMATGLLRGFAVVAPGTTQREVVRGLTVLWAHKITLEDIAARNSGNASLALTLSYKITGRTLDCHQRYTSTLGTHYGLAGANIQDADLSGAFTGARHGISFGGGAIFSIPVRAVRVHDFVARNESGVIAAADWHGNVEHCVYELGVCYGGGFNLAGNNNRVSNCKVYGAGSVASLIYGREILGCNHVFESIEYQTSSAGIPIDVGVNSAPMNATVTRYGGRMVFRDIHIEAPAATSHGINIRNRGFTAETWDLITDQITYIAPAVTGATVCAVRLDTISGNAPARVAATNIVTSPNVTSDLGLGQPADAGVLVRQSPQEGAFPITTDTSIGIVDTPVTFPRKFAKIPVVMTNPTNDITSSDRCGSVARGVSATGFTARYRRIDQVGNFSGAITLSVMWAAHVNEW